jgi:hypothetical protein
MVLLVLVVLDGLTRDDGGKGRPGLGSPGVPREGIAVAP